MNVIDLVLIIPLLWAAWRGFRKGLIVEVFSLLALFAGIYGGIHFSDQVAMWLSDEISIKESYLPVVSFAVTFIAVVIAVYFIGKAIEKVAHMAALKPVNKILGAAFGIAKVALIISLSLVFLDPLNRSAQLIPEESIEESFLYSPVKGFSLVILPVIKESSFWESLKNKKLLPNLEENTEENATL